ncbi:MAG: hypothetical protein AB7S92_24525 [Parvibaculaceae bacterium]
MMRPRELEARQDELTERLSRVPVDIPDIHPNVAGIYRQKAERLAEALQRPQERDEAADAIRALIDRITLTPCAQSRRDRSHTARQSGHDPRMGDAEAEHFRPGGLGSVGFSGCGERNLPLVMALPGRCMKRLDGRLGGRPWRSGRGRAFLRLRHRPSIRMGFDGICSIMSVLDAMSADRRN